MINTLISACIVTHNDESCIGACVDSLGICAEVVVVDAQSTDRTREIAAARGARVVAGGWMDSRLQKLFAVRQATHDWVFSIAADERMSAQLTAEIVRIRPYGLGDHAGYEIPLLTNYRGEPPAPGDRLSDYRLRLFDRRRAGFRADDGRDGLVTVGPVKKLRGHISHEASRALEPDVGSAVRYAKPASGGLDRVPQRKSREFDASPLFVSDPRRK